MTRFNYGENPSTSDIPLLGDLTFYSYFGKFDGFHWYLTLGGTAKPDLVAIKGQRCRTVDKCFQTVIEVIIKNQDYDIYNHSFHKEAIKPYPEVEGAWDRYWVFPNNTRSWSKENFTRGYEPVEQIL